MDRNQVFMFIVIMFIPVFFGDLMLMCWVVGICYDHGLNLLVSKLIAIVVCLAIPLVGYYLINRRLK